MKHRQPIAFLLSSFRAGGGEKQMVEIANAMAARGHKVDLLVLKPVGDLKDKVRPEIRVISLDRGRIALSFFPLARYFVKEKPYSLLAVDEFTHLLALMARGVTFSHTKVVLRIGNMLSELFKRYTGLKNRLVPSAVRLLYKRADYIVANSRGVADNAALVTGVDPARLVVIYNPKPVAEIRARAGEPVESPWLAQGHVEPVVAWFGRLREQKNLPVLMRAFAAVQSTIPGRLVLVGQGREQKRLEALAQELGIAGRVLFAGYHDNPYKFVAKADVYAACSLWEGLPNALLEALACGVPCVAADCDSGPREILAPDTPYTKRLTSGSEWAKYGILTAVNDVEALAEVLRKLLSDEPLRAKYAQEAAKRAEDFDIGTLIVEYEKLLISSK